MPSFRERRVARVFSAVVRATPQGAARPWRTARSLDAIRKVLDEGISEGDLVAFAAAAGELVERHREEPRWWSCANLFGEKTLDVWRSKIEAMQEVDRHQAATREAMAEIDAEHQRRADTAPPPEVHSLALERLIRTAAAAQRDRWDATTADDVDQEA